MIPMPGTSSADKDVPLPELPDAFTLFKIMMLAAKSKYHHVVLLALLLNELGFIARVLG